MADAHFLLDSNICIYLLQGSVAPLNARVRTQGRGSLAVSAISYAEIRLGIRAPEAERALQGFLRDVLLLPFDAAAAEAYAGLPFRRARLDRLIAAQALAGGLTLITNNERDFADIPDLRIENWTL
ncbi:type II toxin-antitoxin system VapC family toxin [Sphingomonas sp. HT-1]|uniref:type II toxin-antitoxin system VapC family toxin n=1 Tax=unclassified Sphingomonas TaxID=196159 RepID=UPI0003172869|nr:MULTISPECIES: type II toxin-antitoxin system VapC family toxin [unclassified Sphingomonas]KTF67722.1 twitching motility protein PilT [Sphingomonas sp. WG]